MGRAVKGFRDIREKRVPEDRTLWRRSARGTVCKRESVNSAHFCSLPGKARPRGAVQTRAESKKTVTQRFLIAAAAAGAGTTCAAAVRGGQGHRRFYRKTHIGQINFNPLHLGQQVFVDTEGKSALFLSLILII